MSAAPPSLILITRIAADEGWAVGAESIEPVHLLLGLAKFCDVRLRGVGEDANLRRFLPELEASAAELRGVFEEAHVDPTAFRRRLRGLLQVSDRTRAQQQELHRSPEARGVFSRAEELAAQGTEGVLRPVHLLTTILALEGGAWRTVLAEMQASVESLASAARRTGLQGPKVAPRDDEERPPPAKERRQSKEEDESVVAKFGRDLTKLAASGQLSPVVGRRSEIKAVAQILIQQRKNNALLVGEAGVGKTSVVEGLARRLVEPDPPAALEGKRIVEVSMSGLVAGTKYRGDFEKRLEALVQESMADRDLIIFIDEIHTLLGAGGEGSSDAANILKPALARGEIRCIGATTLAEYRQYIEKDAALERRFQVVMVEEPSANEAIEMLLGLKGTFEQHHHLVIRDEAVRASVELSLRYLPDFRLPDKAIDLLDQACAQTQMATLSPPTGPAARQPEIGRREICKVIAQRCRIPVDDLTEDEAERLLQLDDFLRRRVVGQDRAVQVVAETIRAARAGLKRADKPVGVFLFAGPTGTGKTELAKALATFLFGDPRWLIRIDMSEYMEQHAVARLIGAPPGYVGHDEPGQLTGPMRTNPYSVVLLDEIEKAHPRVLDLFLQVFDEGRLTDAKGRHASFRESVIILTSNLGSSGAGEAPKQSLGFSIPEDTTKAEEESRRSRVQAALRAALRPELLNRIGRIILFEPLTAGALRQIVDKIIDEVRTRLVPRRVSLRISEAVYALLLTEGWNPEYGARELERTVERFVAQPLAHALLEGTVADGETVEAIPVDGAVVFRRL